MWQHRKRSGDAATSQGRARRAGSQQSPGSHKEAFSQTPFRWTLTLLTLISNFWPPVLKENKALLFKATHFVAFCDGSPGKLTS